jgi:LETM1 and EF-hand domain-containing protein 1
VLPSTIASCNHLNHHTTTNVTHIAFPVLLSARMSFNRAATKAAPLLLQRSALRGGSRRFPSTVPAIAILIPRHYVSTQHSTSTTTSTTVPPPGFKLEEAKKALPSDQQKSTPQDSQSISSIKGIPDQHAIPKAEATALPKTDGAEAHSLTEMANAKGNSKEEQQKALAKKAEEKKKLTLWQKVKHEANHYWDGTKLLAAEVKISSRLALKMAAGYELTRREHRQVCFSKWTINYEMLTCDSFNEQCKISVALFHFPCSSSFLLPNCFYPSP